MSCNEQSRGPSIYMYVECYTNPDWDNFVYVCSLCVLCWCCFMLHLHVLFLCSDIPAYVYLSWIHSTLWEILIIVLNFNFLCKSVWFITTVCKEEVSSVVLVLFITPMLKYYCSTNHQSCFSTMRVTLLPLSISNISSKSHRKCFVWVLQLGKRVVSSFWPTRCSAFPYCQKKSA